MNKIRLKIYIGSHVKYPLFLSGFSETRIFSTGFRKTLISNFTENRSVGAEFPADGQMGMKLIVAFMRTRLKSTGEGGKQISRQFTWSCPKTTEGSDVKSHFNPFHS